MRQAAWGCATGLVVAACAPAFAATSTGTTTGTLFYTTNTAPIGFSIPNATVDSVSFTYSDTGTPTLTVGTPQLIATLPSAQNADGIIFDSSGNLLVGSAGLQIPLLGLSGTNEIVQYTKSGITYTPGTVQTVPSGPFHLTLNGSTVYSGGTFGAVSGLAVAGDTPGPLVSTPSNLSSAGATLAITGADTTFTEVAFTPGGTAFYTSSPDTGTGNYGTLNLSTKVSTKLGTTAAAHGVIYDPYSNTIILTGGNQIEQLNASTGALLASVTVGSQFVLDQGSSDGSGHLFIGDNNGSLVVVDLTQTAGSLTGASVTSTALATNLDDLAPLDSFGPPVTVSPTSPPVSPPPVSPPPVSPPPTSPPPTSPPPTTAVPLPAGVWMGLTVLGPLALGYHRKRRQLA